MTPRTAVLVALFVPSIALGDGIILGEPMRFSPNACADTRLACNSPAAKPTSIVALLGNPNSWKDKAVGVKGFLAYDMHGTILFMSTEHCLAGNEQYGVQVHNEELESVAAQISSTQCRPAYAEGVYHPSEEYEYEPGTFAIRDRPGLIELKYLIVDGHDT